MNSLNEAVLKAKECMPGHVLSSITELRDGWVFNFSSAEGTALDIPPLFISKDLKNVVPFAFEEYAEELLESESIDISHLSL